VGAWASDSDFNGGEAYGNLGNLLAVSDTVFDVQSNGVLDVRDGLFVAVSLAIAALERRARNEVTVRICFDNDRKSYIFHD
jgi:hypothetical protein